MPLYPHLSDLSDAEFNAYTARVEAAMARYHAHYNNATYQAIQQSVVYDLCGAYQAHEPKLLERALSLPEINTLLNLVTDGALEISQHPDMEGKCAQVLRSIVHWPIREETLQAIAAHWKNFETEGQVFSVDFETPGQAALRLKALIQALEPVTQLISDMSGASGNAAHGLARAAFRLLRAAQLLLSSETSESYIGEQIRAAEHHLADSRLFLKKLRRSAPEKSAPLEQSIQPYQTLVLSADKTYPGLVTEVNDQMVVITWHKWGYDGETFCEAMSFTQMRQYIISADECQRRFGGLPPAYKS